MDSERRYAKQGISSSVHRPSAKGKYVDERRLTRVSEYENDTGGDVVGADDRHVFYRYRKKEKTFIDIFQKSVPYNTTCC